MAVSGRTHQGQGEQCVWSTHLAAAEGATTQAGALAAVAFTGAAWAGALATVTGAGASSFHTVGSASMAAAMTASNSSSNMPRLSRAPLGTRCTAAILNHSSVAPHRQPDAARQRKAAPRIPLWTRVQEEARASATSRELVNRSDF